MSVLSELDVSGDRDAAVKESIQDYSRICEYKILTEMFSMLSAPIIAIS